MSTGGWRVRWDRVVLLAVVVVGIVSLVVTAALGSAHPTRSDSPPPAASLSSAAPAARPQEQRCPATRQVIRSAPPIGDARTVALTFDDGPGATTDRVLKILSDEQVHATFFVIGRQVAAHGEQAGRTVAAGHAVENHSWSHRPPSPGHGWRSAEIKRQISRTQAEVIKATGRTPCFFRPPEGVLKGATGPAYAAHASIVLWSVDTRDWAHPKESDAAVIRQNAQAGLGQDHPVVLLHDGGGGRAGTIAALPGIIDDYRRQGYVFVTMDGRV